MGLTQRLVQGIRYIPTLPTVLTQILATLNDERSSAGDLERIIENDQALSSKILAVANSAYYGFRHKIFTVRRATVALGYEEVRNICLGASLMAYLHPTNFSDQRLAQRLWLHSLACAEASRLVAKQAKELDEDSCFTAGLLHDLGKVVLAAFYPEELIRLQQLMAAEGLSYRQAEKAQGVDHAKVGKALGQNWDLPPMICEVMGYHHEFHSALIHLPVVCVVHVADSLCHAQPWSASGDDPAPPPMNGRALDHLGLRENTLETIRAGLNARRTPILELWRTLTSAQAES